MSKETSGLFQNRLPSNPAQLHHMFSVRPGHLSDTPKNRETLRRIANNHSLFMGTDQYGNDWYVEPLGNGGQHWAQVRNGVIFEGGYNRTPLEWDPNTGLKKPVKPGKSYRNTKPVIKPKKRGTK